MAERFTEFCILGRMIRLECRAQKHEPWFEVLAFMFSSAVERCPSENGGEVYTCHIVDDGAEHPSFVMYDPRGAPVAPPTRLFVWALASVLPEYLFLHGACVVGNDGKAILIMGPPGSGKTTTAMFLAQHGLSLYSDDLTALEPNTYRACPMPFGVNLKGSSPFVSSLDRSLPVVAPHDGAMQVPLETLGLRRPNANDRAQLGALCYIHYSPEASMRVRRLPQVELMPVLLRQVVSPGTVRHDRNSAAASVSLCVEMSGRFAGYEVWTNGPVTELFAQIVAKEEVSHVVD